MNGYELAQLILAVSLGLAFVGGVIVGGLIFDRRQ